MDLTLSKDKFTKNLHSMQYFIQILCRALLPTLNFMIEIDYVTAYNLYEWIARDLAKTKGLSYAPCFWSYCIFSILENPVDSDCLANINLLLKKAFEGLQT